MVCFIPLVFAADSLVLQIPYCFNVSIAAKQLQGNFSPISFLGCSLVDGLWVCDCHNTVGMYNLTLRTDNVWVDVPRFYKFDLVYNTYVLEKFSGIQIADDRGLYTNFDGSIDRLGANVLTIMKPIYDNQTVYLDSFVQNISYIDRID